jgi:hypothetical protein
MMKKNKEGGNGNGKTDICFNLISLKRAQAGNEKRKTKI